MYWYQNDFDRYSVNLLLSGSLFLQVWSFQMETSTGTARAWAAWPADLVALSSKRPFPVSTIARKRSRAQSASTTSVICRSACRGTQSSILRRKIKQSPTLVLPPTPPPRALPYHLKLTLPQPLQNLSRLSHLTACHLQTTRLPAKLTHFSSRLLISEYEHCPV